jgi:hypothetical protein
VKTLEIHGNLKGASQKDVDQKQKELQWIMLTTHTEKGKKKLVSWYNANKEMCADLKVSGLLYEIPIPFSVFVTILAEGRG